MTRSRNKPGLAKIMDNRITLDETPVQSRHRLTGARIMRKDNGELVECRVNLGESPLGWLSRRKDTNGRPFIAGYHVEAGDRLRADFTKGQGTTVMTQNWGAVPRDKNKIGPSSGLTLGEAALAARQRFENAVDAMGPEFADIVVRTCCYLQGMEAAEKEHGWPARSGKVILKMALERLADHYGLKLGGAKNRKKRVWKS